jgi:hypothetical protein
MPLASPRSSGRAYDGAPLEWSDAREWMRRIAETANGVLAGKLNSTGTFTLTVNSLTTVVDDPRCGPDSVVLWCPTTETAGGEVGMYVTSRGVETAGIRGFTVNHGFDSRSDRTFAYVLIG